MEWIRASERIPKNDADVCLKMGITYCSGLKIGCIELDANGFYFRVQVSDEYGYVDYERVERSMFEHIYWLDESIQSPASEQKLSIAMEALEKINERCVTGVYDTSEVAFIALTVQDALNKILPSPPTGEIK